MKTTKLLLALFVALASTCNTYAQRTEVIAHRGYWKTAGSAQNSLASIREADRIACYGSELDVWMTSDKVLVVNHDRTFKGVTIQDASLKTCSTITLDNGEQLPTLRQYLKKARKLQVKIILELKSHRALEQELVLRSCLGQVIGEFFQYREAVFPPQDRLLRPARPKSSFRARYSLIPLSC